MPSVDDRLVSIDRYVAVGLRLPRLDRQRLRRLAGGSIVAAAALSALLFFLSPGAADRTGVRRQVFTEISFNGAPLRDDIGDAITLDFLNDGPDLPRRFFSARWTGFWYVPEAGDVELHGAGDDRLDVWLDGELVIRRTPPADMHTLVRTLRLDAGVHELRVEYEQHGGAFNMRLKWALPGGRARPLPPYRLFHERPDTGDVRLAYGVAWLQRLVATLWIAVIGISLAWLAALVWSRVGPQSTYGPYWASAFRVSRTVFRVAIAGPLGLPASRGTGPSLEDSDPANRGTGGHFLADSNGPRTRRTVAILLGLLFVGHVGVFGWRSVTFDRRVTADSMNYIDVARNLSAGEGLVQSAAGFNQPTFWVRDCTPHFPEKTRAGHNPGYSSLIAAVAAVTGLEHADAAFVIGPAAYAAALASAFLFACSPPGTCRRPTGGGVRRPPDPLGVPAHVDRARGDRPAPRPAGAPCVRRYAPAGRYGGPAGGAHATRAERLRTDIGAGWIGLFAWRRLPGAPAAAVCRGGQHRNGGSVPR